MNLDRNSQIDKQSNKTTIKLSKFLSLILRHKPDIIGLTLDARGLVRQNRHHVHLSANRVTAIEVGKRHGKPAILKIAAEKMHDAGLEFFLAQNNVWLTDSVPPKYISSQQ